MGGDGCFGCSFTLESFFLGHAIQRASYGCRLYDTNIVHMYSHLLDYQQTLKTLRTQQAGSTREMTIIAVLWYES